MRNAVAPVAALALVACRTAPLPPAPQPAPVTPTPTAAQPPPADTAAELPKLRLPRTFVPTGYAARLEIDPGKLAFGGEIAITGTIAERAQVLWLHGRGLSITSSVATHDGASVQLAVTPRGEDLLEIRPASPLDPGTWTLALAYTGTLTEIETAGAFRQVADGASYVMSQGEAVFARRIFPCLDEPDIKVPWTLTLDVPNGNVAVANTPVAKQSSLDAGHTRFEFEKTLPLPSYLIAFGVGPFDIVEAGKTKRGVPVRIVTMKGRAADAAYAAKTTARIVDLEEEWFGIPYPYGKLDMLTIPITVGFGAMENPGLITFAETLMLFEPQKLSWEQRERYVAIAAHEIAHQWFGDYVTMKWWDDIWLNEGFASWIGGKITAKFDPSWHEEVSELDTRITALDADSIVSARKVRQPIELPDDINNAFDRITYRKGATVLNMFEAYVGADVFQRGVRDYLKSHAFGNATSADFGAAIAAAAKQDIAPAFASFLDQAGAPEITTTLACEKGQAPRVELSQERFVPPGSPPPPATTPWIVPVCVAYEKSGKRAEACTLLSAQTGTLALDTKSCPRWLYANANGRGHYRGHYSVAQATALRDEAWPHLLPTERRALFFDVAQAVRLPRTKLPLTLMLSLVPKMLAGGDRFTIDDAADAPLAYKRFIADDQRAKFEGWVRATFGPGAAKLGFRAKAGDDIDAEQSRLKLLELAAWYGRDPDLVKQATALAASWRDLPIAIRRLVLEIATDASPDLHAKLMREVKTEPDRLRREDMFSALGSVRDARRYEAALELLLDPEVDFRESSELLEVHATEPLRQIAERFVRGYEKELLARMPRETVTGAAGLLVKLFTDGCNAATRDEVAEYVADHFHMLSGAKRVIEQDIEAMDQCIAKRALVEPELRGWLSGVKLPRAAR